MWFIQPAYTQVQIFHIIPLALWVNIHLIWIPLLAKGNRSHSIVILYIVYSWLIYTVQVNSSNGRIPKITKYRLTLQHQDWNEPGLTLWHVWLRVRCVYGLFVVDHTGKPHAHTPGTVPHTDTTSVYTPPPRPTAYIIVFLKNNNNNNNQAIICYWWFCLYWSAE